MTAVKQSGLADTVILWEGDPYTAMAAADVAITKSGSVNVELALLGVPQVVVYRIDNLTAWIARNVFSFNVKHISLVNLILDQAVVPEYIQEAATPDVVAAAVRELLPDASGGQARQKMLIQYAHLRDALGAPGVADRAASMIIDLATQT